MPSLSTREIARRKREHIPVYDHDKWESNNHSFGLIWDTWLQRWVIRGGCREWRNLSEALSHYHKGWHSTDGITTEAKRLARRRIVTSIARFARKNKFKMRPEESR